MVDNHFSSAIPHGLSLADRLMAGADGRCGEAAVMIVTGTVHGRLVSGIPLAWDDQTTAAIDWGRARSELAVMSGGEAGLFALADSLATGEPVDLDDALAGLDPRNGQIVLAAFEHAIALAPRTPRAER